VMTWAGPHTLDAMPDFRIYEINKLAHRGTGSTDHLSKR
jgi:hypothetical protein